MRLVLATDAEKWDRDALAWQAWGQRLDVDEFRRREARLRGAAWAREGMRTWFLVDGGMVLSSCETFRMTSTLRGEPGSTQGVASVFTEPALRGRGYAGAMMDLLAAQLRSEAGTHASILFSDVGPALYGRSGWVAVPGVDRVFDPAPGGAEAVADALLSQSDLAAELERLPPGRGNFEVRASADQIGWHLERERAYADLLGLPRPTICGARAGKSLLLWCANLKVGELLGLLWRPADEASGAAVIEAACRVARSVGLERVVLWEHGTEQPWPAKGRREVRTDSLPMIAPLAEGLAAADWVDTDRALWI